MKTDPKGRTVLGLDLRPLACWDCGFESRQGHRCLSHVIVVCCHHDRPLPLGQPGQSKHLATPNTYKFELKMRIFAILWQQRVYWTNGVYIARLDV
jgi:hypothetical protein